MPVRPKIGTFCDHGSPLDLEESQYFPGVYLITPLY